MAHMVLDVSVNVDVKMEQSVITYLEAAHAHRDGEACSVRNLARMVILDSIARSVVIDFLGTILQQLMMPVTDLGGATAGTHRLQQVPILLF